MALQLRPNCEYCDKDLPPNAADARICSYECTFCADCVESKLSQCLPELRRRLCAAADPARQAMAARHVHRGAAAFGQARPSQIRPRTLPSIARGYRTSRRNSGRRCCHRNNGKLLRRQDRPFDFAKTDAVAVALAPAAHDERIAVFEERPLGTAGQSQRLGTVPADLRAGCRAKSLSRPLMVPLPNTLADVHRAAGRSVVHQLLHRRSLCPVTWAASSRRLRSTAPILTGSLSM